MKSTRPARACQGAALLLSTLVRNVPVLHSIEMSPSGKKRVLVDARGKLVCSFPRTCGRVLPASTGPAVSTGSSWLHGRPRASVLGHLLVHVEIGRAHV